MRPSPLVVAVLDELPTQQLAVLRAQLPLADVRQARLDRTSLASARWILTRAEPVDTAVLNAAMDLDGVIGLGADTGTIDELACAARRVKVYSISSPALETVAEHTVMLILMLFKRYQEASRRLRDGLVAGNVQPALTTQQAYAYNWVGLERFEGLAGQTIGLVGLGVIGSRTARLLRSFDVDVAYTKRTRLSAEQELSIGVRFLALPDLLAQSRCVSLHNRFTEETDEMIGEREFALMRPGSFFVNTARGRLVDEKALSAALESGRLAGAALDVFRYEPLPKDSPLLRAPNLILTPHVGGIPLAEAQLIEVREAARVIEREAA